MQKGQQQQRKGIENMEKKNLDIRKAAQAAGIMLWQIAQLYGVNDSNFSRKLRKELPAEEKDRIFAIIEELKAAEA